MAWFAYISNQGVISPFNLGLTWVLFSRNFADAENRENKTLMKISKFTASILQYCFS